MTTNSIIESLQRQITTCEAQLEDLRRQLAEAELERYRQLEQERLRHTHATDDPLTHDMNYGIADAFRSEVYAALLPNSEEEKSTSKVWPLEKAEYKRYGRQLIMPEIGLQGN